VAAGVLGNLDGAQGVAAWRWLFIIEGVITMTIALSAIVFLPNYPTTTSWLSPELQAYVSCRILRDTAGTSDGLDTTTAIVPSFSWSPGARTRFRGHLSNAHP
jgi:hypothetical protein